VGSRRVSPLKLGRQIRGQTHGAWVMLSSGHTLIRSGQAKNGFDNLEAQNELLRLSLVLEL
jgi:hypothetical protein